MIALAVCLCVLGLHHSRGRRSWSGGLLLCAHVLGASLFIRTRARCSHLRYRGFKPYSLGKFYVPWKSEEVTKVVDIPGTVPLSHALATTSTVSFISEHLHVQDPGTEGQSAQVSQMQATSSSLGFRV